MRPIKGMNTDFRPISQPDDTTRFVLNGIQDGFDGNLGSVSTEPGNEFCFSMGTETIGVITLADEEVIIFSVAADGSYSEIGLAKNCTYTSLVQSDCLNFSKDFPIKGVSRIKDCERIIYFYDSNNEDRYLNLDNLEQFLIPNETLISTSTSKWDCEKFKLNFSFEVISVDNLEVLPLGSQLEEGSCAFAFSYIDDSGNQTDYFSFTDTVNIKDNNSIRLTLSNIDDSYTFLRIAVILFTTDDGTTTSVYELPKVGISGDTMTYLFNSINSATNTDLGDINIPGSNFVNSKAMDIVNGRLVRANLKERDIDWAAFQREALNVNTRWITKGESVSKSTNQKEITQKSLRRDEVYSVGIVYVFNDGLESPVFHIPGRAADDATYLVPGNNTPHWRTQTLGDWDTEDVTVVQGVTVTDNQVGSYAVEHLNLSIGDTAPRWQIYNTAIKDQLLTNTNGYWSESGLMGYYESQELYPESVNCNAEEAFGDLAGTPIKYHRMPDLTIAPVHFVFGTPYQAPILDTELVFHLGIELDNVNLPFGFENEIAGYRIVYSRIDDPTVVDSGILELTTYARHNVPANADPEYYVSQGVPFHENEIDNSKLTSGITSTSRGQGSSDKYYSYHSPVSKMQGSMPDSEYVVTHRLLQGTIDERYNGAPPADPDFGERRYFTWLKDRSFFSEDSTRTILETKDIGQNTILAEGDLYFTNAGQQEVSMIESNFRFEFSNFLLNGVAHIPIEFLTVTDEDFIYYPLVSLKRSTVPLSVYNLITYVQFDGKLYNDTNITVFGGDTYIVDFAFRKTSRAIEEEESGLDLDVPWYDISSVVRFYSESSRNVNLREEADGAIFIASDDTTQDGDVFYPQSLSLDNFLTRQPEFRNYYYTNLDFDVKNFYKEHRALFTSYEYCNGCNEYPNLIAYSDISTDVDQFDNFRKFKVNNLTTIPGSRGEITNLVYFRNNILVFTKDSLFQLKPNPQQVVTDSGSIYLGTAEFLAIPANEIIQAEHGHAGTSGRFNIKKTPYGLFYVDIEQGKIYKFYDGLEDISSLGMHNFFQERRGYDINKQLNETLNLDYEYLDNTIQDFGVGTISVYDPRYERFIITKKDLEALEEVNKIYQCIPYPIFTDGGANFSEAECSVYCFTINEVGAINPPAGTGTPYDWYFDLSNGFDLQIGQYARGYPQLYVFNSINTTANFTDIVKYGPTANTALTFVPAGTSDFSNKITTEANKKWVANDFLIGTTTEGPYSYANNIKADAAFSNATWSIYKQSSFIGVDVLQFYQINPEAYEGIYVEMATDAAFIGNSTNADVSIVRLLSPGIAEEWYTNPNTGKVVEYNITQKIVAEFDITNPGLFQGSPQIIPNKSLYHHIGVSVPESDNWDFDIDLTFVTTDTATAPTAYILYNGSVKIPILVTGTTQSGFASYQVTVDLTEDYTKGDTLDLYIDNSDDNSDLLVPVNSTGIPLSLKSTTDLPRSKCFYTNASDIFNNDNFAGLSLVGYPTGLFTASVKQGYAEEQLFKLSTVYSRASTTYTAAGSPYIFESAPATAGVYEVLEETSPLEFIDVLLGATNYEIVVKNAETGDQIGEFVYDATTSTNNGYDTFDFVPTGQFSHVDLLQNGDLIIMELTVLADTTSEIEHNEGLMYYKVVDTQTEVRDSFCTDFIIQTHDSLTATTGTSFSLNVNDTERIINYFENDLAGTFDIYFENDINITNPDFAFNVYINGVSYPVTQGSILDPDKLFASIKNVSLNKGDTIMLTVTNVSGSADAYTGEWLTHLIKLDYACVEALPKANKSHTVSFDVKNNHWVSFHSYLPKYYYNDSQSYYSTPDLLNWYKHTDRNYNTYYQTKYPHVVEFVTRDVNTIILNSLQWVGKVERYDEINKDWIEVEDGTYNKALIYNSRQSTGVQDLDFDESIINWSNTSKRIVKSDYNYRISGIRNLATAQPISTSSWGEIEDTFEEYGYIDKTPLLSSINYNMAMPDLSPLRDKYQVIRLIYDGDEVYRISLDLASTQQQYSNK